MEQEEGVREFMSLRRIVFEAVEKGDGAAMGEDVHVDVDVNVNVDMNGI